MNRRAFVHAVGAGALAPTAARAFAVPPAARVNAAASVFYAPPDGRANLVRFVARDVDAPAGRLRVYDAGGRLVGTAGMIRRGTALFGELWLPLARPTAVATELEAPGVRGVVRNRHRLTPAPRWTIHWITVVAAGDLARALERLVLPARAVRSAALTTAGVRGNPLPPPEDTWLYDHVPFLRMGHLAEALERRHGVPVSPLAVADDPERYPATTPLALAGSGVRCVALPWCADRPVAWWRGPADTRVLALAVPPGSDPEHLGFAEARDEMGRRVEEWLLTLPPPFGPLERSGDIAMDRHALALGTAPPARAADMYAAVRTWNARYAYPRIRVGLDDELLQTIERRHLAAPVIEPAHRPPPLPTAAALARTQTVRAAERARRLQQMFTPLAALAGAVPAGADALRAVAAAVDSGTAGAVVFNGSPFSRTDVVRLPDGSERVVTDVPEVGYAFVPERRREAGEHEEQGEAVAETAQYRLRLDEQSGAIASLVSRGDGREWVRSGSDGWNAAPHAILEAVTAVRLPGVGRRLRARRWAPELGGFETTVTVYDALPWVDIENAAADGRAAAVEYAFAFALDRPHVRWDMPAGSMERTAPVERLVHVRWLALDAADGSVLWSAPEAPYAAVDEAGTLVSSAPSGRVRYRVEPSPETPGAARRARFGWSADPLVALPVPAQEGPLPRFGRLLVADQPGIAIVGIEPAEGGGAVAYVQELLGAGRLVSIGSGLLGVGPARVVSFLGRETDASALPVTEGAIVEMAAHGAVALRLDGVRLRGA